MLACGARSWSWPSPGAGRGRTPTIRDVLDIYDLRLLLEPPAAEAAAGRLPPEELARLQALADPPVDPDDEDSVERFIAANRAIHLALVEAAGNARAALIVERLLDDSERARRVALRSGAANRGPVPARSCSRCSARSRPVTAPGPQS